MEWLPKVQRMESQVESLFENGSVRLNRMKGFRLGFIKIRLDRVLIRKSEIWRKNASNNDFRER